MGKSKKAADESAPRNAFTPEVTFYDTSVVKITADGIECISDHVGPGEKLRRETTDRYTL